MLLLSREDVLNNGEELKGLLSAANLRALGWGTEVETEREGRGCRVRLGAGWQLWAVRAADLLQISLDMRRRGFNQAMMNVLWRAER